MECSSEGASSCWGSYLAFTVISSSDELIQTDEWCNQEDYWEIIQDLATSHDVTCDDVLGNPEYALNLNGLMGYCVLLAQQ